MNKKEKFLQIENSNEFNETLASALSNNEISKDEWYELNKEYYSNLYLAKDNPRGQSGHRGDEFHYLHSHLLLVEAINKDGSFLDVGCANGYLLESLKKWTSGIGYKLEFYGIDISEKMIDLAKERLPQWESHFFVGNGITWMPENKFDFVCVKQLSYVPDDDELDFFHHMMDNYLNHGGRLIFGPYWYEKGNDNILEKFIELGIEPTGFAEKSHYSRKNMIRKILYFDKI